MSKQHERELDVDEVDTNPRSRVKNSWLHSLKPIVESIAALIFIVLAPLAVWEYSREVETFQQDSKDRRLELTLAIYDRFDPSIVLERDVLLFQDDVITLYVPIENTQKDLVVVRSMTTGIRSCSDSISEFGDELAVEATLFPLGGKNVLAFTVTPKQEMLDGDYEIIGVFTTYSPAGSEFVDQFDVDFGSLAFGSMKSLDPTSDQFPRQDATSNSDRRILGFTRSYLVKRVFSVSNGVFVGSERGACEEYIDQNRAELMNRFSPRYSLSSHE